MPSERAIERTLPEPLLAQFSEFIAARLGLYFPRERWRDLEQATARAAGDLGCENAGACVERMLSRPVSRGHIEILASHLTIGETYFFRDKLSFESLEQQVLPELIRARRTSGRRLRIWSAGCSTGEEPYSVAMLLARMIPDLAQWNISILATDINPRALKKAAKGVYSEWSFRDALPGVKTAFFTQDSQGKYEVLPRIKALVTFAYLNLVDDPYPWVGNNTNAIDIIFCRNVLMYFEAARSLQLMMRLSSCLVDGGWLFVNPVEAPHVPLPLLTTIHFPGALVYRKSGGPMKSEPALVAMPLRYAVPELDERPPAAAPPAREGEARDTENAPFLGQSQYAEAPVRADQPALQEPADADAMGLLATTYANQGRLADAVQWCEKAARADRLNPRWCYLLGNILQEQGKTEDAVAALQRALYLDQSYALAHFALGNLTRQLGKRKESARHYRNAIAVLGAQPADDVLPGSEGITAGRLAEIIASTMFTADHHET